MSPVHVLVSEDPADEQAWAAAFQGAVDLYRFGRNAEAFERLTSAASPIDLVVITQNQDGPFNLTADQLVARVIDSPIGGTGPLAGLYAVVVGEQVRSTNPRVACVSTLAAAIRLIKFGELERAPRPVVRHDDAPRRPDVDRELAMLGGVELDVEGVRGDSMFASSVISRIWDAGDQAAAEAKRQLQGRRRIEGGGGAAAAQAPAAQAEQRSGERRTAGEEQPARRPAPRRQPQPVAAAQQAAAVERQVSVSNGARVSGAMQLFANDPPHPASLTAARLAAPLAPGQVAQPSLAVQPHVVTGGGAAALVEPAVGAPGESVEVGTGIGLLPSRPYQVHGGAGYRGPGMRGGNVHSGAGHVPVPPALAQQVHSMIYPAQGPVADPLLTWSGSSGGTVTTKAVPVPQGGVHPLPTQGIAPVQAAPQAPQVAMPQPPAQRAPAAPRIAAPQHSPAAANDPMLRRAEADPGVSFG